jgi:hypothetical protein
VSERYRDGLRERFADVCARHGVAFSRYYRSEDDEVEEPAPSQGPAQLALWGS